MQADLSAPTPNVRPNPTPKARPECAPPAARAPKGRRPQLVFKASLVLKEKQAGLKKQSGRAFKGKALALVSSHADTASPKSG